MADDHPWELQKRQRSEQEWSVSVLVLAMIVKYRERRV